MANEKTFIGVDALQQIATKYTPNVILGAAHFRADVFERMGIAVITGIKFKDIKTIMNRKGHTTRRKVVGEGVANQAGYLEERPMECHLAWNRYIDNQDNYIEKAVLAEGVSGSAVYSYPASELAFQAAVANYGEDLFDCLWHGDDSYDSDDAELGYLSLYTGFITYLNHDIEVGRIAKVHKNMVSVSAITAPTSTTDVTAWNEVKKFRNAWAPALKNAKKVLVYCSDITGEAIADSYANSKGNNKDVIYMENGNFKVPAWPNVEFCPEASFGVGDKLIATTPQNFEYGVNEMDSRSRITVKVGSDNDNLDVAFQVESVQGTRVLNVNASNFCMTDGELLPNDLAGDYTKNLYIFATNDATLGKVTVNSAEAPVNGKEYAAGQSLTLAATAETKGEFVAWSDGDKTATRTFVTKPFPGGLTAIFKAKG